MIGILGGTFDPVHNGHILLAQQALQKIPLSEVHFLPCAIPVHRRIPVADSDQRKRMIEIALRGRRQMRLNALELERDGASYMIDTVTAMKAANPAEILCLLLGQDAFNSFANWKAPDAILNLAHLIVCNRPGQRPHKSSYRGRWIIQPESLGDNNHGNIFALTIEPCDCSSTQIRQQLGCGQIPHDCLPAAVVEYILSQQLYEN